MTSQQLQNGKRRQGKAAKAVPARHDGLPGGFNGLPPSSQRGNLKFY